MSIDLEMEDSSSQSNQSLSEKDIDRMKVADLKNQLKKLGLMTTGNLISSFFSLLISLISFYCF